MTKKHFEAIAKTLRDNKADKYVCEALAFDFGLFNPNFDRERFLTACGF